MSLSQALAIEQWDYVTIQQVSGLSGVLDSYYPYLNQLIDYVKQRTNAQIVFHQTWCYESDAEHPDFFRYDCDREKMWQSILSASTQVCQRENLPQIECGKAIYQMGNSALFDKNASGFGLYRDGYHLNFAFGRLFTASIWIKYFTGKLPAYLLRDNLTKQYQSLRDYLLTV